MKTSLNINLKRILENKSTIDYPTCKCKCKQGSIYYVLTYKRSDQYYTSKVNSMKFMIDLNSPLSKEKYGPLFEKGEFRLVVSLMTSFEWLLLC